MSKLDDILDPMDWGYLYQISDYATSKQQESEFEEAGKAEIAEAKQAIKDLILELIGEDKEIPRSLDEESRARFYRVSGQNFTKNELRQKVAEL